ncbi:MAG TPA: adenylate/guanylate cyclase domain-containing protein [bacterium]|nr:adenylate/guanylate cyclase domain-containing protein [bacterium]
MKAELEVVLSGEKPLKFDLGENLTVTLGRTEESDWVVPFERYLSRRHVDLRMKSGKLLVKRLSGTTNPIFYKGEEKEAFTLETGEQFVIGKTRFHFNIKSRQIVQEDSPLLRYSMQEPAAFSKSLMSDRMRLLDLLELPEILRLKSPAESFTHIAGMLRTLTHGSWSRISESNGKLLGLDSILDNDIEPAMSHALVEEALKQSPHPTLYCWSSPEQNLKATVQDGTDWAICTAYQVPGEAPLIFYVAGQGGDEPSLKDNCRLVGLIADMVGRSLSVSRLEGFKKRLERFFSGAVISKIIESPDTKDLEPRLTEGTVMFFDIRGFSRLIEGKSEDALAHMRQLKEVMTALTEEIFKENGVVLQFLGDGILACWNVPFADSDHINQACRAALGMVESLGKVAPGWRCGIGIHTGEVIAGPMGAKQLFSYTVMGAVVNQASRVEGITKAVEVPILITKDVADKLIPGTVATRRVGKFQPAGMDTALDLFYVTDPPANKENESLYTLGLEAFESGEWEKAYELLDKLPPSDRPARYLKTMAETYRRKHPKDWKGIIELSEK